MFEIINDDDRIIIVKEAKKTGSPPDLPPVCDIPPLAVVRKEDAR